MMGRLKRVAQLLRAGETALTLYIFSLVVTSSSLLAIFFSTPNRTPSVAKIPMQIPAWPMASIAYSTW